MDRLEEYIRKNREALDIHSPSAEIWLKVNNTMRPRRPVKKWLAIAASVAVLAVLSVFFYQAGRNSVNQRLVSDEEMPARLQLREADAYYTKQINSLYNEAEPLLTANPELKAELNNDLIQVDSIYADLKKDLKDNIANQDVVEALIRNYEIKIEILQEMLDVLRDDNNHEKTESHEL